jgi:hypothetical protein
MHKKFSLLHEGQGKINVRAMRKMHVSFSLLREATNGHTRMRERGKCTSVFPYYVRDNEWASVNEGRGKCT